MGCTGFRKQISGVTCETMPAKVGAGLQVVDVDVRRWRQLYLTRVAGVVDVTTRDLLMEASQQKSRPT